MNKAKSLLVFAMLIFGSIGLVVRSIPYSSAQIALVRGVIGSIFLLVFGFILNQNLSWKRIQPNLLILIASGIAIGINWILLFQAYKYTTISMATICYYFAPVLVMFLSPFILKESLNTVKILCILFAMAGMFCVVGMDNSTVGTKDLMGIIFGLSAAVLYATVIILNKFLKDISSVERTFVQLGVSALSLFPYVLLSGGIELFNASGTSILLLLVVGVLHTGIGYLIYFSSMEKLSSQTVAAFSYIDPVSAILMSSIFLHENLTLVQVLGGILILGATFINERYGA